VGEEGSQEGITAEEEVVTAAGADGAAVEGAGAEDHERATRRFGRP